MSKRADVSAAAQPLVFAIWTTSYLAIDLIMWAGGRSTLVSNIVISLPMMLTAPALTLALEKVRRRLLHLGPVPTAFALVPLAIGAAMAQGVVDYSVVRVAATILFADWQAYVPSEHRQFGFGIYVYTLHFLCCLLALTLLQARHSVEVAARQHDEALGARRRAEAKALRLQLNPHFLFNALNSIAALVATGGNRVADAMICRLSDFMRATMMVAAENDVSLAHEIATTESYLAIERLRFGDRLSFAFSIAPDAWDAAIPALILQPLGENAVKHGLAGPHSAIHLQIDVKRMGDLLAITVTDRRVTMNADAGRIAVGGTGIGLSNVRDRVALFGEGRGQVETEILADGFCVRLVIPYLRFATAGGPSQ
ncbi:MAG: histidine kinase [Sphingopyxis sp.]|uniref:sensor histidine kinase n=1 Tax=Sphingopyxis sp. TaxID=1908224 RepID=UPI0032EB5204